MNPAILCTSISKQSLVIFILHILSFSVYSQELNVNLNDKKSNGNNPGFLPPSPQAASLGVYGQIPVGNFTGVPQVNIPLYTISYKELNVPIALNYFSSGNKPDQFPGPVGLGWSLQAGGTVTRIIRGAPDYEIADIDFSGLVPENFNPTEEATWSTDSSLLDKLQDGFASPEDKNNPDEFYYNINGISGKFYLHHSGEFKVRSTDGHYFNVTIQVEEGKAIKLPALSQPGTYDPPAFAYKDTLFKEILIYKITMIDGNGIKYTFGGTDQSIEFSRPGAKAGLFSNSNLTRRVAPTTWNLTSVESPNGYKVLFYYKQGYEVTKVLYNDRQSWSWSNNMGQTPLPGTSFQNVHVEKSTLMNVCYLTKIISPIDSVIFYTSVANQQLRYTRDGYIDSLAYYEANNAWPPGGTNNESNFSWYKDIYYHNTQDIIPDKYDGLSVYDKNGNPHRMIGFYFTSDTTTRLKLKEIRIGGRSMITYQQYKLDYNPLALPLYLSGKTDFYGYYNNRTAYFPAFSTPLSALCEDTVRLSKMPDTAYVQAEILQKITYPTGGFTLFQYEPHTYRTTVSEWPFEATIQGSNQITGGVRIKKVTSYTDPGKIASVKEYFYNKDFKTGGTISSGVLAYAPSYWEGYTNATVTPPAKYAGSPNYTGTVSLWHLSTNPIYPMGDTKGNHVLYSEVTEMYADSSFTVFKYKNYDNGYGDKEPENVRSDNTAIKNFWEEEEGVSMDLERGQLLSEEFYNAGKTLKRKNIYTYNDTTARFDDQVRVLNYSRNNLPFYSWRILATQVYTYFPFLKQITSTEYEDTDSLTSVSSYEYNTEYRALTKQSESTSEGRTLSTIKRYPFDMSGDPDAAIYATMISRGMVHPVIELEQQSNNVKLGKSITSYALDIAQNDTLVLPAVIKTQHRSAAIENRSRMLLYDSIGCLLSSAVELGDTSCYVWSYAHNYPVAKIVHANYGTVQTVLGGTNRIDSFARAMPTNAEVHNFLAALRTDPALAASRVSTYTYLPLTGMTTERDMNGVYTYYDYDNMGRLIHIRDNENRILKKICYNYAGQPVDCRGDINTLNFVYSLDKEEICSRDTMIPIGETTAYAEVDNDIVTLDLDTFLYTNATLSVALPTGYYMRAADYYRPAPITPVIYYVENGRLLYQMSCSGNFPYELMFAGDLSDSASVCDGSFPVVYAYTSGGVAPVLGQFLQDARSFSNSVKNGYYKYPAGNKFFKVEEGEIMEEYACVPPAPPYQTVYLDYTVFPFSCPYFAPVTYYYDAALLTIGTTLYMDDGLTITAGFGYYSDGTYKYVVDFDGVITDVQVCF